MLNSQVELSLSIRKNGLLLADYAKAFKAVASEEVLKVVEIAANSSYVIDLTGLDNIALLAVLAQYNESITSGSNQVVEGNPATVGITFNSNTRNAFGFEAIGLNKSVSTPIVTLVNSHPEAKILIYFAAFCEA